MTGKHGIAPLQTSVSKWKTAFIAMCIALAGAICIFIAIKVGEHNQSIWWTLLRELGGLLIISGTVSFVTEMALRRQVLDEVLAKIELKSELKDSGVTKVLTDFSSLGDWKHYFNRGKHVIAYFSYGRSWRNYQGGAIREYCAEKDNKLTIILPETDGAIFEGLAAEYSLTPDELRTEITKAIAEFEEIGQNAGAEIEVLQVESPQAYAAYDFGQVMIVTMYNNSIKRVHSIPIFEIEGGTLGTFFKKDLEELIARAKAVYKNR